MNIESEGGYSKFNNDEKGLPFYASASFILHACVIALFIGIGIWLAKLGFAQREANLRLIESSVRVDMVAMPRMSIQELKSIEQMDYKISDKLEVEAPAKKEEAAPEPTPAAAQVEDKSPTLIEEKKLSFSDMLKAEAKKKVAKSAPKAQEKKQGLDSGTLKEIQSLALAGNKLQKGTRLTGTSSGEESSAFGDYASKIPDHIRPYWRLPSYLLEQELRARIRVWLGTDGKVLKAEIFESSGNKEFDDKALSAVKQSSPLPEPPDLARASVLRGDILLGFPL